MNIKQLSPLNTIKDESKGQQILQMALQRELNLYIISKHRGGPIQLDIGRIQLILEYHPNKVLVCFNSHSGYITPPKAVADMAIAHGKASEVCYKDLWVRSIDLETLIKNDERPVNEISNLNIMACLKDIILISGQNHLTPQALSDNDSPFKNQTSLIRFMLENYSDIVGVNKRTLEDKFACLNKIVKDWQN